MTAADRTLVLVTEATGRSGAGHAMRLGTLAAAWKRRGGRAVVIGAIELDFVQERYRGLGIEASDDGADLASDVVVVDSYDAATRFAWSKRSGYGLRVLVDDTADGDLPRGFDVVWNPNAYGSASMYVNSPAVVLAGVDYLAIREGLPRWASAGQTEILVTLGGGVPSQVLVESMYRLDALLDSEDFVATGDWAPPRWRRISADRLWAEVPNARQLLVAAGTTVWEAAAVGIPVILLMTADNQRLVYRWGRDAAIPGINTLLVDAEFLAHQLRSLLAVPSPLPAVADGTDRVVGRLIELLTSKGAVHATS